MRPMNAKGYSEGEKQRQSIRQGTIALPYFDQEVPVLYLADGTAYLPVKSLCRIPGLRAETHIPRWRKLILWANVRKLSLQTVRGQRMVWCLHMGALPVCPVPDIMNKGIREVILLRKVPEQDGNQEAAAIYGRIQSESGAGEPASRYHH